MDNPANTISSSGYLPTGRRIFVTLAITSAEDAVLKAIELDALMTTHGLTVNLPGLEAGESKEQIVTVMRREKPADGTPIIDFYPAWGEGGDEPFGTYKYLHIYLDRNKPEMVTEFLTASGFKSLEDIPLYDAQSPLKRSKGRAHAKETRVPKPFFVVKKQGDEKIGSDGQPYRPWEFVRYESSTAPQQNGTRPTPPAGSPPAPSENGNGTHTDEKPATPKNAAPAGQLMPTENSEFVLRSNWVQPHETEIKGKKTIYYEVEGGATTYSREPFRKVGYTDQDLEMWTLDTTRRITLLTPLDVYYKPVTSNGREFKQIVRVEKVEESF